MNLNSTQRFSDRVENYIKFRPSYPTEILDFLSSKLGFSKSSLVADIGSGTGLLTKIFLENGNSVFAVEPNKEMREAGEKILSEFTNLKSIDGTAEVTTLAEKSIDFVVAGQAFHWFEIVKTKAEFKRILKPNGFVVLVWNKRRNDKPFLVEYEKLIQEFAVDYEKIKHTSADKGKEVQEFFGGEKLNVKTFDNFQEFDFEGLKGRLLSSSYAPNENHPNHKPMIQALKQLFKQFQQNGQIRIDYKTNVFWGRV
ncbi:MAG: class I SAM-dependent methyltransferase [Calditrichaeota bacterium]|nr:MAG: class I SAM-dependent methyltransferase [Calditrichota bacterium]